MVGFSTFALFEFSRERFLVVTFQDKYTEGLKQLQEWFLTGKLKVSTLTVHDQLTAIQLGFFSTKQ